MFLSNSLGLFFSPKKTAILLFCFILLGLCVIISFQNLLQLFSTQFFAGFIGRCSQLFPVAPLPRCKGTECRAEQSIAAVGATSLAWEL